MRSPASLALALGLAILAVLARSLDWPDVFLGGGTVVLNPFDCAYHARRALFTFERFPAILLFDPLLAYPGGAAVPIPPLYDWLLGAVARALGRFDLVLAWVSPAAAGAVALAVAGIGRRVAGVGVGLGAAALYAVLPVAVGFARVGNCDHHSSIALLAALYLLASFAVLAPRAGGGEPRSGCTAFAAGAIGLCLVRIAVVFSWSGSLLYLALGETALLVGALAAPQTGRRALAAQAVGCTVAALATSAWLLRVGTPFGGPFAGPLSYLQVAALLAAAAVSGALALWDRARPAASIGVHALRAFAVGAVLLGAGLTLPALRDAIAPLLDLASKTDAWSPTNVEQRALFGDARAWRGPFDLYGALAYLLPLAWLAPFVLARDANRRAPALALGVWCVGLGVLAVEQVRFGNDFAVPGAVGFALVGGAAVRWLAPHIGRSAALAGVVALALLGVGPAVVANSWPMLRRMGLEAPAEPPRNGLVRFAEMVRAATPDLEAFFDPSIPAEYGIVVAPTFGHALHYPGRRAVPANNMGSFLDPQHYRAALDLLAAPSEAEALAIAERLHLRYVMTAASARVGTARFEDALHRHDGSAGDGRAHSGRLRLVVEGPPGARPLRLRFPRQRPPRVTPYKLFEIVAGAQLRVPAGPGGASAEVELETMLGRRLVWRAEAAGEDGIAVLRVPYASVGETRAARALGPYTVRTAAGEVQLHVSERDVVEGRVLDVVEALARHAQKE